MTLTTPVSHGTTLRTRTVATEAVPDDAIVDARAALATITTFLAQSEMTAATVSPHCARARDADAGMPATNFVGLVTTAARRSPASTTGVYTRPLGQGAWRSGGSVNEGEVRNAGCHAWRRGAYGRNHA